MVSLARVSCSKLTTSMIRENVVCEGNAACKADEVIRMDRRKDAAGMLEESGAGDCEDDGDVKVDATLTMLVS